MAGLHLSVSARGWTDAFSQKLPPNLAAATLRSPGVAASSLASLEAPLFQQPVLKEERVLGVCPRAYIY